MQNQVLNDFGKIFMDMKSIYSTTQLVIFYVSWGNVKDQVLSDILLCTENYKILLHVAFRQFRLALARYPREKVVLPEPKTSSYFLVHIKYFTMFGNGNEYLVTQFYTPKHNFICSRTCVSFYYYTCLLNCCRN